MSKTSEKIESVVSQGRVKLHIFEPSKRKIWTVVGMGEEHWLDPDLDYCSCPGYYFGKLNKKQGCYHLEAAIVAKKENKFETISFLDEEYADFVAGLISDL